MMVAKTVSVRFPLQYKYEYLGTDFHQKTLTLKSTIFTVSHPDG